MEDSSERCEISLYRINPIGVGTTYIESLPSYIKRVAVAHSISPATLLYEITRFKNFTTIYNPAGELARQLAYILEYMTGIVDTKKMYLDLGGRYSFVRYWCPRVIRTKELFRKHLAWCPQCFEDSITSHNEVYEQMFWCFSSAKVCSKHQTRLVEECPYCKSRVRILSVNSVVGYCTSCFSWLGFSDYNNLQINDADNLKCISINEIISRLIVRNTAANNLNDKNATLDCNMDMELLVRYMLGDFDDKSHIDEKIESVFSKEMSIWLEEILRDIDFVVPKAIHNDQSFSI